MGCAHQFPTDGADDKSWAQPTLRDFIEVEDGGKDLFFHHSAVNTDNGFPTLCPGDAVEFNIGQNRRGPVAENVRKLSR